MILELLGWSANILFAILGVPDVVKCFKNRMPSDSSWSFLIMWLIAQVFAFTYLLIKDIEANITHYPMYFSYIFGGLCAVFLIYSKLCFNNGHKIH